MGIGAVLIILGIILGFIWSWVIGIILVILGLLVRRLPQGTLVPELESVTP